MDFKGQLKIFAFVAAIFSSVPATVRDSMALPLFARRIGRDCAFCHAAFPKLNERGRIFRSNGYRFAEEGTWEDVRRWETIPLSMEVEIEGLYNRTKASGEETEDSDLKIGEVELFTAGTIGRKGKVSFHGNIGVEEAVSSDGSTNFDPFIGEAFVQVNDLLGPGGEGMLNIRAGQWEVGALPFLSLSQRLIKARYLAQNSLKIFSPDQRALELNGSIVAPEDSYLPTHRYSLGISRDDTEDDDRIKGFYSTYSVTMAEAVSLGAVFRTGREKSGGGDTSYIKYGFAGEVYTGPFILDAGFFTSDWNGGPTLNNYLAEVAVIPIKRILFAARFDMVTQSESKDATLVGVTARYNILSNVFVMAEYNRFRNPEHVTGTIDEEKRVRFFLVALL